MRHKPPAMAAAPAPVRRGGAPGKHQLGQRGQLASANIRGAGGKADGKAMLVFNDALRAMQGQRLRVPREIGGGDEEIKRMPRRQQRRTHRAGGHHIQRLGQQPRKADAAKGRLEPA